MPLPIQSTGLIRPIPDIQPPKAAGAGAAEGGDFRSLLNQAVHQVESYRREAATGVEQLLSGQREDLHNVALATQRSELAFELFLQTRNKVVQAYQEIMRMQV